MLWMLKVFVLVDGDDAGVGIGVGIGVGVDVGVLISIIMMTLTTLIVVGTHSLKNGTSSLTA